MSIIQPFDIGCEPSSVPAETLIQNGWQTYLLFHAVSKKLNNKGFLEDMGVAVLACKSCSMTKFGYPNDEGLPEHSLYRGGLEKMETNIVRVIDSAWLNELEKQIKASAKRIWGGRGMQPNINLESKRNHFIITLKERTFECISNDIKVVRYATNFDEAIKFVHKKLEND
ncbi:MAG: hypothetical protein GQ569_03140 [Methylococcaceae bacterium]|nr:hypothetical protein [Methylococcaceae bacterium]